MINFRKNPLLFTIIIIISFFHLPCLSRSYATSAFKDDEEKQRLVINLHPQSVSGYESLMLHVSDSEEDLAHSPLSEQREREDFGKCHACCLSYHRAIPCWTDAAITIALVASSIIIPTMTYFPINESTRWTIGTIGSCAAFSGLIVKAYRWCVVDPLKEGLG
ncbi:MAG: hypothetical protein K2X53_04395 [Alphaproteobacteria bacterium]|nr:hypothetical protein [Alphaproteobacteria bacterium]